VPECLATLRVVKLEEFQLAIAFQRARCIIEHPAVSLLAFLLLWVLKGVIEGGNATLRVANLGDNDLLS